MQICFFTDERSKNFLPLTLTRPVDDLRIGILTIREKWENYLNAANTTRLTPPYLEKVFPKGSLKNTPTYWINSRFIPDPELTSEILSLSGNSCLTQGDDIIAAFLDENLSNTFFSGNEFSASELSKKKYSGNALSIEYLWELLSLNGDQISADIDLLEPECLTEVGIPDNVITQNPDNIFLSKSALIEPGCIIIADKAPVYIGPGAIIEAGSIIKGPVSICDGAVIKMASRISEATTIGPVCKVGGEVMNSIFHSFSNKAHDGFVGNSLVGQWCNFGADSNTSNLKNNYGLVKLIEWSTKTPYEQGTQFFGSVLGDHSKTSINSMLNTGTSCGVSSNILTSGFTPKLINSFSWLTDNGNTIYDIEKALQTMRAMMKRRKVEMTSGYEEMMRYLFNNR